jgi:hypothetical protein
MEKFVRIHHRRSGSVIHRLRLDPTRPSLSSSCLRVIVWLAGDRLLLLLPRLWLVLSLTNSLTVLLMRLTILVIVILAILIIVDVDL